MNKIAYEQRSGRVLYVYALLKLSFRRGDLHRPDMITNGDTCLISYYGA